MNGTKKIAECHICKGHLKKKKLGNTKVNFCPECGAIEPLDDWVNKIRVSAY